METGDIDTFQILAWMHLHDHAHVDWASGGILFAAATLAALTTLFSTSPDDLPWLGGAESVHATMNTLQSLETDQIHTISTGKTNKGREWLISHYQGKLSTERRLLFFRGIPIFLIVGPVLAAAVATTIWQSLVIGATGPAAWRILDLRSRTRALAADAAPTIARLTQALEDRTNVSLAQGAPDTPGRQDELLSAAYEALEHMRA